MGTQAPAAVAADGRRGTKAPSEDRVRSVHRAFSLLSAFGPEQPTATLTQLARQSDLPVTTAARLLGTLESLNFVRRLADGSYGLGIRLFQIGVAAHQTFDIIEIAAPHLVTLNEITGENANLAIRSDEKTFTYIRQYMTRHPVRHASWVGRSQPIKGTANGAALRGKINRDGYAATRKTIEPDISAVAAPVRDADGGIIASVSVTGPTYRISDEKLARYGALVVQTANRISGVLTAQST
jgi:IclR family acetate operon transcriptional repressor